jgi:hypothetical protein
VFFDIFQNIAPNTVMVVINDTFAFIELEIKQAASDF